MGQGSSKHRAHSLSGDAGRALTKRLLPGSPRGTGGETRGQGGPGAATLMMIFSRSWLGEGSWSALASVGFVSSRSPNTSLNTLAMWRCCSTQQCSSMDRITGKLRAAAGQRLSRGRGPAPPPRPPEPGPPCAPGLKGVPAGSRGLAGSDSGQEGAGGRGVCACLCVAQAYLRVCPCGMYLCV